MKESSQELRDYIKNGGAFFSRATLKMAGYKILNLEPTDFVMNGGFTIKEATSNKKSFDIGGVIPRECIIKLNNYDGRFDDCDFQSAFFDNTEVFATLPSGTTETIKKGLYFVNKADFKGGIVTLTCSDILSMWNNLLYTGKRSGTAIEIVNYALSKLPDSAIGFGLPGIAVSIKGFNNKDLPIDIPNGEFTVREIVEYVMQITCNNMCIKSEGAESITIGWYDTSLLDLSDDLIIAGTYTDPSTDIVDAGSYTNMATDINSGLAYADINKRLNVDIVFNHSVNTDNVEITGVKVVDADNREYLSGNANGHVIVISGNPLTVGREQEIADLIATTVIGMLFRPLEVTTINNPLIEAGDVGTVTIKGNTYATIFTNVEYSVGKYTKLSCGIDTETKSSTGYVGGTTNFGGANNVNGLIKVYDENGNIIGLWDKDGINITNGSIDISTTKMSVIKVNNTSTPLPNMVSYVEMRSNSTLVAANIYNADDEENAKAYTTEISPTQVYVYEGYGGGTSINSQGLQIGGTLLTEEQLIKLLTLIS